MANKKIKFSIIIPTYNHLEDCLIPCLTSLVQYTDLSDGEVIICANGCKDDTREWVERWREGQPIELLWFDEGLGYTKATNEGIKVAKGEIIILMNNDVVLLPQNKNDWINLLCNPLKDKVAVTCPLKLYSPSAERDFAVFFCVAIKKEMFDKIGLLDETFSPGSGEDTDFCIKVEQLGYQVLQVPTNDVRINGSVMVGNFPIYHKGEATMLDAEHSKKWHEVIKRNEEILSNRHKLPSGWFYGGDIEEYRRLVENMPVGGVLGELGCYKGRSLCSVADIIKRKKIKVYVVDIFTGTDCEVKESDYEQEFIDNAIRFGLEPISYKMTTDQAVDIFEDKTFDLLFIDACHEYEAIKNDIAKWEPKVREVIAGHDFGSHAGIAKAVNERYDNVRVSGSVWSKRI